MRIAVVTPTIGRESLVAALESVAKQVGDFEIHHVVVYDGIKLADSLECAKATMTSIIEVLERKVSDPAERFAALKRAVADIAGCGSDGAVKRKDQASERSTIHDIWLPSAARDAGATPRAAGVAYAWGAIKPDVIAFLDDDVEWEPGHLALAAQGAAAGADVITSRRWLLEYDTGRRIRVDETDSDGVEFADTSAIALAGRAMWFAATWNKGQLSSGSDREFWSRLRNSTRRIVCHGQPTVLYRTPWAVHYIGEEFRPPNPAKWVATDESGKRIALLDEPIYNPATQRWEPKSQHQVAIGPEAA